MIRKKGNHKRIWCFEKIVRQQVKPIVGAITQKKFTVELGDANVSANEWHSSLTQCLPYHQNVIFLFGDILTALLRACSPKTDNFETKISYVNWLPQTDLHKARAGCLASKSLDVFICAVGTNQVFSGCSRQKSLVRFQQISKEISKMLCQTIG